MTYIQFRHKPNQIGDYANQEKYMNMAAHVQEP